MSTLQSTPRLRDRIGSRLGTILLALSVLCAIGVAVLILAPSRHHAHKPTATSSAAHAPVTPAAPVTPVTPVAPVPVPSPAPHGYFRDPVTHALLRVSGSPSGGAAPVPVPSPAPPGYFRDPVTHALLRVGSSPSGGAPRTAIHSQGRVAP